MKILKVLLVLMMPVMVLLFSSMAIIMDDDFFYGQFNENGVYLSVPEADDVYYNLSFYLVKGGELDQSYYSETEVKHLEDVKIIIGTASYLLVILIISSISITAYLFVRKDYSGAGTSFFIGGILSFVISVVLAAYAYFSFNDFFLMFHQIMFKNDFWMLPSSSMLIRLFPQEFFFAAAKRVVFSCMLLSSFSVVKGIVLRVLPKKL
ncbi:MAG: DUF1461 domain-containing protein [Candidatus Woesearchaeota archaeon]